MQSSTIARSGAVTGQQQRRGVAAVASAAPSQRPRVTLARAVETQTRPSLTKPQATATSSVDFQDAPVAQRPAGAPAPPAPKSGHKGAGGPFAPAVQVVRGVMGEKEFNKFRGQAISLHSQVIKTFGSQFGVNSKQVQGLIRTAKKNGEWLGFLA